MTDFKEKKDISGQKNKQGLSLRRKNDSQGNKKNYHSQGHFLTCNKNVPKMDQNLAEYPAKRTHGPQLMRQAWSRGTIKILYMATI